MHNSTYAVCLAAVALTVSACNEAREPSEPTAPPAEQSATQVPHQSAASSPDHWIGQWAGPEGTFLKLSKAEAGYAITIQNLDGPAHYSGVRVRDHIEFERNGEVESIRATDGKGTGMKWLQDKQDCLVVVTGEGYCRD